MREYFLAENGKSAEPKVFSPQEAVKQIYIGLGASEIWVDNLNSEWTPFGEIKCTIAHGTVGDGHLASLEFKGVARFFKRSTEVIAHGVIDDPHDVSNRGDTVVFAKTGEIPKASEREDFLKRIISYVAFNYESPELFLGAEINLGGIRFGHGSFGQGAAIKGGFVSVDRRRWPAGMDPTDRIGRSIEITQTLINNLLEEIEGIRNSTRF